MADLTGRNNSILTPSHLGGLGFEAATGTAPTSDTLSFTDSVGAYLSLTPSTATPGIDPTDYFTFTPSGIGKVKIDFDSLSGGTYADLIWILPLTGVSEVNGGVVATNYGGSPGRYRDAVDAGAEGLFDLLRDGTIATEADVSGARWTRDDDIEAEWTLDGSLVRFEVTGFRLEGSPGGFQFFVPVDEVSYSLEISPLDPIFSDIGNGGLLFNDTLGYAETHTGGDTIDTYRFDGSRSDFSVESILGDEITVQNQRSSRALDKLVNIERVQLDDGYLAFDTDGNAGQMYRLYQAAFDRDPDVAGLGHWIDTYDRGLFDLKGVAQEFLISDEFEQRFGTSETLDDEAFLTLMYNNVLDRTPDQAGFDFWSTQQDNGLSRADILQYFSESVENYENVAVEIDAGIFYL